MTPKLIEASGTGGNSTRIREVGIQAEEFLLGRGTDCNLRLRSAAISRHHCLLRFRATEATLTDLGSSNGTFVNGKRIRSQTSLQSGDEIALGPYRFILDLCDRPDLNVSSEIDPAAVTCKLPRPKSNT